MIFTIFHTFATKDTLIVMNNRPEFSNFYFITQISFKESQSIRDLNITVSQRYTLTFIF